MSDLQEYIGLLQEIVRTPSVSGNEKAVADLVEGFIAGKGKCVHRKLDNIWVESEPIGCGKPTILLNAHLDTVAPSAEYSFNPFSGEISDGKLLGLGSNDDGGSLVALLAAFFELCSKEQPYRLVYSATAMEENSGELGFDSVKADWGPVTLGIIGEPTGMQMAAAEKGLLVLDCVAHGKSGHAARKEGVNAIYEAMSDLEWIRSYNFPKLSPYLGPVKMTTTIINAGSVHNVIPDSCSFTVDIRSNGEYTNEEILSVIKQNLKSEVKPRSMKNKSSSISLKHPVFLRGQSLGLRAFGSPTASNQLRCDFPTLKIGPGESERSHTADEFILIDEIEEAISIYVKLLDKLQI